LRVAGAGSNAGSSKTPEDAPSPLPDAGHDEAPTGDDERDTDAVDGRWAVIATDRDEPPAIVGESDDDRARRD
jgi:hypothetical protein